MYRYSQGRRVPTGFFSLSGLKQRLKQLKKGSWIKNLFLLLLAGLLFGTLCLFGIFVYYSQQLPDPDEILNRELSQATKIYDRTGEHLLYEIAPDQNRTLVTIDQIPLTAQQATITAEDRGFYNHNGISFKGILRAILTNLVHLDPNGQGASTITQQFIKKAFLTDDRTYSRKVKEIIIAIALEKKFEKDEILQMYLNEIPYGGTNYGIESAAQAYFNKSVKDVSLAEAATLAALPNRPSTFLNNPDLLKDRRDWILGGMVEEGYITQAQADEALVQDTPVSLSVHNIQAPHFVLWVKEQLEEKYGAKTTETGGLRVVTSLDYDKQKIAEEAVTNGLAAKGATYKFNDIGLVSVDPKTGQVLAMVGSPDYWNDDADGQVNVTLRKLQPGSSIKPLVYATAFERGFTPNSVLWDVETTFPTATGPYNPHNYDGKEHGYVTLRKALQGSLNIPAVKTLYLAGIENVLTMGDRLGYTTLRDEFVGLSMVLGGVRVTPLEHTNAFATFANNGLHHDTVSILKVTDSHGATLEEWTAEENPGVQAMNSNLAATVSNVLSDNNARAYVFGTNNYLTLGNRPVAAKTGTTNEFKDAWTVGYTPSLATGVWVGNARGSVMNSRADGSVVAAPVWKEYMDRSLKGSPIEPFPAASIKLTGKPVLDGRIPATTFVIDTSTGKLATDLTPERYRQEKTCGEYHTILTYVKISDPQGTAPANPAKADAYYTPWEAGIQAYVTKSGAVEGQPKLEVCEIPTESDDVHTIRNQPSISITSPHNQDAVGRNVTIEIEVESKRPFDRVEYTIDGTFIGASRSRDGLTLPLPSWVSTGEHILAAAVFDDVDNSAEDSARVTINEPGSEGSFRITNPFDGQEIEKTVPAYSIAIEVPNIQNLATLQVTAHNLWTGEETLVGEVFSPQSITTMAWTLPAAAEYVLTASARTSGSNPSILVSTPVTVLVKDPAQTGGIPVEPPAPAL